MVLPLTDRLFNQPPRSSAFIVTIYGDIVEPRGGVLSMANLIDLCSNAGLNESLVRTSVSRLVNAGQLRGERSGRKSYYRLTQATRLEFSRVASTLYYPPSPSSQWMFIARRDIQNDPDLEKSGFALIHKNLAVGTHRSEPPLDGLVFAAHIVKDEQRLHDFAASLWDLENLEQLYKKFIQKYEGFLTLSRKLSDHDCLIIRLSLVHDFRLVLAADPRLPLEALPDSWAGFTARDIFNRLYLKLSPAAEDYIGHYLSGEDGLLSAHSHETQRRHASLQKLLEQKSAL